MQRTLKVWAFVFGEKKQKKKTQENLRDITNLVLSQFLSKLALELLYANKLFPLMK